MILEEARKKSFRTFLKTFSKTICLHGRQLVLVAGLSNKTVQSLQLEHDGLSNLHMELIVFLPGEKQIH